MITGLIFLFIGLVFIVTLFKGIFKLLGHDFGPQGLNAKGVIGLFKGPIIACILLFIYVIWVLPYLQSMGYE